MSVLHHHLEYPPPGATLPPGEVELRGWVWPTRGEPVVDVRARVGAQVFPGVHGLPRADLAAHFQTGQPYALAEFSVVVTVAPGRVELTLEALDLAGHWRVFHTGEYAVGGEGPPGRVPRPGGALRWHEYGRALQVLLQAQRAEPATPVETLAARLAAGLPYPRDLRHPHLPFHGHLDEPATLTRCGFGRAAVLGWLFHESQPIRRVLGTFDLQVWQTVEHGRPSPGPAEVFPQFAPAAHAGLFGILDVPAQLPSPVCLRLYAELADGSLHLCAVQRSRLYTQEDEKAPYPAATANGFDRTHTALQTALATRGIPLVEDEELREELARRREECARRAPAALSVVPPPRPAPATLSAPLPSRVLLVTHNLNLEGAPLFLLDYAQHLASCGVQLTVVSPDEGPLRARFEALGASVRLTDLAALWRAHTRTEAQAALAAATRDLPFAAHDLVVANTFTTFWAVHAARAAGRPVLLYVHESTTPASFYLGRMDPVVVALAEEAFALADAVSFTTASTRAYHTDYGRPERHWLTPGWIEVARLDAWRSQNPREILRARFGLRPDEWLVTNVGTVCDRKGQHIFTRAVDLLWRRHPELAARARFVMLGGGDTPFDATLRDLLAHAGRPNFEVHPATADYLPYYVAADLFVCSTYEESSPRVILEAMACETTLLSSGVHGVLEQVRPELEATLVPPGDTVALAEGMARLLRTPAVGRELAARARARVLTEFDAAVLLPRHAALAAMVAHGGTGG
jgi:glycosyltransferase involved in cell wall biosynthesis